LAVRINVFGFDGAAFDVTEFAHPASIFFEKALPLGLRRRYQPPDPRDFSGMLLGKRLERRRGDGYRRRAAKQRDELAPVAHSITSLRLPGSLLSNCCATRMMSSLR